MEKENRVFTYEELRARLDEVANFALYAIELWIFDYVNSGHKTPKDREEISRGLTVSSMMPEEVLQKAIVRLPNVIS